MFLNCICVVHFYDNLVNDRPFKKMQIFLLDFIMENLINSAENNRILFNIGVTVYSALCPHIPAKFNRYDKSQEVFNGITDQFAK